MRNVKPTELTALVNKFSQKLSLAQQVLEQYKIGAASLEDTAQCLKELNTIEGEISVEIGSPIRQYYLNVIEAKKARIDENIRQLGYTP